MAKEKENCNKICSFIVLCAFSCAASASFLESSSSPRCVSKAGMKVFPIGG